MRESVASRTARRVAIRRAEHQILDRPPVFEDPLALRILDEKAAATVRPGAVSRQQRLSPSFRAFMAVRSRYAEDELRDAVAAGVRQFVVLGAGLDTFAYRNPYPELNVFEVDHPATQAWKRERLAEGGIDIPATMTFVPVDFERQSLEEQLAISGFRLESPAFFSWLGVTPYLTDRAFQETLQFVAARPAGSGIVFDYAVDPALLNFVERIALAALSERVKKAEEPFQLFLDPEKLEARLRAIGFTQIEDLGRDQMNERYFAGRSDGLRVRGNVAHLIHAGV